MDLKTFRVSFTLREPMRPRAVRIVKARNAEHAAAIVKLPANASPFLHIKQVDWPMEIDR